jgi:probable phosphoglycerate mutase
MTTTMSLRLYLIRHGETAWSLSGQHTGRTDIPLTARGENEAKGLAWRLQAIPFAHVLTSPRQRARRTCELVGLGPAAEIEPDLAEWDYGDYEGVPSVDIRKTHADWNLFRDGCPNGETPAQVSARADRLIARLRELDGNVALFSHGQFGCVLAARWIGLPPIEAQHFALGTASVSILGCDPHHPKVPVIALWNEASHEMLDSGTSHRLSDKRTLKQQAIERWENEGGEIPNAGSDV